MRNGLENGRLKLIAEAIVIIAVVLLVVFYYSPRVAAPDGAGGQPQVAFPAGLPLPSVTGMFRSVSTASPSGQLQVARSFTSAETADVLFRLYQQFLSGSSSGWIILAERNSPADPAHRSILARNAAGMLTVNISAQSSSVPTAASFVAMLFVNNL